MMEEALKELMEDLEDLNKRIESGEIPKSAFPRYVFSGHKLICEYTGTNWFKCSCGHKWSMREGKYLDDWDELKKVQGLEANLCYSCPGCNKIESVLKTKWYLDHDQNPEWECLECKHRWRAYNGEVCPSCNLDYRDFKPH